MRTRILFTVLSGMLFSLIFVAVSCKKEKKNEPEPFTPSPVPATSPGITISGLKAKYAMNPSANYKYIADSTLYCTVTADESSGNFYKELFVRDGTGAIRIKLTATSSYVIGDSIKVNLKGARLNSEFQQIQLDSVNTATMISKISSGNTVTPVERTIQQITSDPGIINAFQSQLVRIPNAEFFNILFPTYADAVGLLPKNQNIRSCDGFTMQIRTSGYANFASNSLAAGNGSVTGILSQYGNVMQLRIRNFSEVNMNGTLCGSTFLFKDFEDLSVASGGWTTQQVTGLTAWKTGTFNGMKYGVCSNYSVGINSVADAWLISPPMNLNGSINPNLYFKNACNYAGPLLEVYVSTNYNGGLPVSATWSTLSPSLSAGSFVYVNSGALSLSSFKSNNTRIAFRYVGTATAGRTWELDEIQVMEN